MLLYLTHYKLYQMRRLSSDKWNVKVGGMIDVNMDVRYNPRLDEWPGWVMKYSIPSFCPEKYQGNFSGWKKSKNVSCS